MTIVFLDTETTSHAPDRRAWEVGAVPNFDADVLGERMRQRNICPSWHYHLIDVETLVVGWVQYKAQHIRRTEPNIRLEPWPPLPWDSEGLSRAVGVEPPAADQRHTALGDARWCRDVYDAVMNPKETS